jgi:acyl carrier protein
MTTNFLDDFENLLVEVLRCSKNDLKDENGPTQISNWDSITHMELVSKIEEKFNLHLDVDEMNQMDTIGAIKNILRKHKVAI